jgi:branched-chain amino acid transport system substrate-binding protein
VLAAMGEIRRFDGVTGTLYFPKGSHVPKKTVTVMAIVKGREKLIEQILPDHVPPP